MLQGQMDWAFTCLNLSAVSDPDYMLVLLVVLLPVQEHNRYRKPNTS